MSSMGSDDVNANKGISTDLANAIINGDVSAALPWESVSAEEIVEKMKKIYPVLQPKPPSQCPRDINIGRAPAAYIVTDNRGKRYLAFAGSVEHENAVMFKYDMEALYA